MSCSAKAKRITSLSLPSSSRRKEAQTKERKAEEVRASLRRLLRDGRAQDIPGVWVFCLRVELPELRPEIVLQRMQRGIARHDRAAERPFVWSLREFSHARIVENVMAHANEGIAAAFLLFQDMIVRLMLEFLRCKFWFQMRAQESHAVELVGILPQPHPDQMQMIRHEAIRRTEKPFAGGGVQEQFAKRGVKRFVEPALPAVRDGKRPMDHRVALIIFAWQAWKIERAVEIAFHDVF